MFKELQKFATGFESGSVPVSNFLLQRVLMRPLETQNILILLTRSFSFWKKREYFNICDTYECQTIRFSRQNDKSLRYNFFH